MIHVVDRKRRVYVYLINIIFFPLWLPYKLIKWNWKSKEDEILNKISRNGISNIYFNTIERMGDILWFTPLAAAIKNEFPQITIHVITNKIGENILKNNPCIDELIIVKSNWVAKNLFSFKEFLKIFDKQYVIEILELRNRNIDLLIEVGGDFRSLLFFNIWLGAKYLSGYSRSGFGWLLDWEMQYPLGKHEIDVRLGIARQLGAEIGTRKMRIYLDQEEIDFANDFLLTKNVNRTDFKIGFFMGGTWQPRLWPIDNFIKLADILFSKYNAKIILIGDITMVEEFNRFLKVFPNAIRTDGNTLRQNASIISNVDIMVSNDSGPMHLARSLSVPIIGLFGPDSQARVGLESDGIGLQHNFPCQPCGQTTCPHKPNCIASIGVEEVLDAIMEVRSKKKFMTHDAQYSFH
ncbi:glycosyltransferase family 9 protein [Desulfonatronum lacustre]|uniref:glycosyltransferase family 9 protein n=1 Tax=Desulfonatronum lacustre TaxID=66849 RepID=UPI00048BBBFD|nr:glycosyltransferase family 9 protein [Desulfonatronum lacustre]